LFHLCAPSVFSVSAVVSLTCDDLTTAGTEDTEDAQSTNQIRTLPFFHLRFTIGDS
jgi:hypothetical protein